MSKLFLGIVVMIVSVGFFESALSGLVGTYEKETIDNWVYGLSFLVFAKFLDSSSNRKKGK